MHTEAEAVLSLRKLDIVCVIGTMPHERVVEQGIEVDIDIALAETKSLTSDDLADAIDYVAVVQLCRDLAGKGKFKLIETLAYTMAKAILEKFPAAWVRIVIDKPRPLPHLESSAIELTVYKEVE